MCVLLDDTLILEFQGSDEGSENDSINFPLPPPPPASPPPPPFSDAVRVPYIPTRPDPVSMHPYGAVASSRDTGQNQWNNNQNSSFNAYQYTDSEAESSHYAYSLNGGQIMLNNTAGSRAPLPGFSSFV